jgi:hypothetical protein
MILLGIESGSVVFFLLRVVPCKEVPEDCMEKLSGLVLDLYDDSRGEILKGLFQARDQVPEVIKQAHYLTSEERAALPDDLFALVLQDGDVTLRKYACVDPGNTLLSMLYLIKTANKLPQQAVELAVENLKIASHWYWPSVEELEKAAGIGGAFLGGLAGIGKNLVGKAVKNPMGALSTGLTIAGGLGAAKQVGQNLRGVNAAEHAAGGFGSIVP